MNARETVRDAIIRQKLLYWKTVALNSSCYQIPAWRARKNYWRLCARYPEIMRQLRLNEGSVI